MVGDCTSFGSDKTFAAVDRLLGSGPGGWPVGAGRWSTRRVDGAASPGFRAGRGGGDRQYYEKRTAPGPRSPRSPGLTVLQRRTCPVPQKVIAAVASAPAGRAGARLLLPCTSPVVGERADPLATHPERPDGPAASPSRCRGGPRDGAPGCAHPVVDVHHARESDTAVRRCRRLRAGAVHLTVPQPCRRCAAVRATGLR
jgi:hypothetical protein